MKKIQNNKGFLSQRAHELSQLIDIESSLQEKRKKKKKEIGLKKKVKKASWKSWSFQDFATYDLTHLNLLCIFFFSAYKNRSV